MVRQAYSEKAQEHNDITAAAAVLGDARRVEGVEGGHYVTEFGGDGNADVDEIRVEVTAKVRDSDDYDEDDVFEGLQEVGSRVHVLDREEKSGFYSPVDSSETFDQPAQTPDEDAEPEWEETRLTVEVVVPLSDEEGDERDDRPLTPIELDRQLGVVPDGGKVQTAADEV